ncbi:MAG TPA: hypothetical protein VIF11_00825 [Methylomirabilota bacterium]
MTRQTLLTIGLLMMLASCGTGKLSAPLGIAGSIAVLPVNNLTADPLLVEGASLIDKYIRHADRVSVGDVLQSEARFRLQEKGFDVGNWDAQQAALKGRVPNSRESALELARQSGARSRLLYLEIRRWEPDAPTQTRFVIVAMTASLIDAPSGQEIWRLDRVAAPVTTPGTINLESAYVVAARKVIVEMLAPLRPAPVLH